MYEITEVHTRRMSCSLKENFTLLKNDLHHMKLPIGIPKGPLEFPKALWNSQGTYGIPEGPWEFQRVFP